MRSWFIVLTCAVALIVAWTLYSRQKPAPIVVDKPPTELRRPVAEPNTEFVQSDACRSCHPDQHSSWHQSYHRSMTQLASASTAVAPFEGQTLTSSGRTYTLSREGDQLWAEMVDMDWESELLAANGNPEAVRDKPRVRRKVVMSTGSHHYQTYWVSSRRGNALWQIPWVFHISEQRWLPANDAFLTAPQTHRRRAVWNSGCIQCHAVNGQPGADPVTGEYDTRVAEFGISCEACHGPGRRHTEFHSGKTAADVTKSDEPDQTIVNPARLSSKLSSHVCGQCHSSFSFSDSEYFQTGFKYRAGDDLHVTRLIHSLDHPYIQGRPDLKLGYWNDGTMRVGGREFSAMDDSACFKDGEMSCLSCHSMHNSKPNDQLAADMESDRACLQCHQEFAKDLSSHTHHPEESSGSRCYNCHMPHTSFALLKAIRSHRIDSPSAAMTAKFGRPNACNLCHLDRTLSWTSENLFNWFGQPQPKLQKEDQTVSSSLALLLRGDAVQRAIVAWHFGWEPAKKVSGIQWQPVFLGFLLNDSYSAVRWIAEKSLRTFAGFEDLEYDYIGTPESLAAMPATILELWEKPQQLEQKNVLIDENGELQETQILEIYRKQDEKPMQLPE